MRLAREHVVLPPLRERREEIPYLIARQGMRASPDFVEACLLHPWPGNVRELLDALKHAVRVAESAKDDVLCVDDLPHAVSLVDAPSERAEDDPPKQGWTPPDRERFANLLAAYQETGSVEAACTIAEVPRTTGYRWLKRSGQL